MTDAFIVIEIEWKMWDSREGKIWDSLTGKYGIAAQENM
jgi:hypothetical protein